MSNERTALIVIGVLGLAFVIALFERLQEPLRPVAGISGDSGIGQLVYGIAIAMLVGSGILYYFQRDRAGTLRSLALWAGIIAALAIALAALTGQFSGGETLSL